MCSERAVQNKNISWKSSWMVVNVAQRKKKTVACGSSDSFEGDAEY